jgi:hypothetical protein
VGLDSICRAVSGAVGGLPRSPQGAATGGVMMLASLLGARPQAFRVPAVRQRA